MKLNPVCLGSPDLNEKPIKNARVCTKGKYESVLGVALGVYTQLGPIRSRRRQKDNKV